MTDVRFDLEPHQWPPHAQGERLGFADAVFAVKWDGKEVEVAARWVAVSSNCALLYFRALEDSVPYVVAYLYGERTSLRFFVKECMNDKSRVPLAEKLTRQALAGWGLTFGVAIHVSLSDLNLPVPQWLFVEHQMTRGAWQSQLPGNSVPFFLSGRNECTADKIRDPNSALGFALQWSQLSSEEQIRRRVCLRSASYEELKSLVRAVVTLDPALSERELRAYFYSNGNFSLGYVEFGSFYDAPFNARTKRWFERFDRHFLRHLHIERASVHACAKHEGYGAIICLSFAPPTQHERLEAALTLREWAKGKIPDREARLLLPKL